MKHGQAVRKCKVAAVLSACEGLRDASLHGTNERLMTNLTTGTEVESATSRVEVSLAKTTGLCREHRGCRALEGRVSLGSIFALLESPWTVCVDGEAGQDSLSPVPHTSACCKGRGQRRAWASRLHCHQRPSTPLPAQQRRSCGTAEAVVQMAQKTACALRAREPGAKRNGYRGNGLARSHKK